MVNLLNSVLNRYLLNLIKNINIHIFNLKYYCHLLLAKIKSTINKRVHHRLFYINLNILDFKIF